MVKQAESFPSRHAVLQLSFLSEVLSPRGKLVASVYLRVPSSLQSGDLELYRVAWIQPRDSGVSQLQRSILIGGAGSKLTEETFVSQPMMSLPRRGHMVVPLSSGAFLVCPALPAHGCHASITER
jgi:hypothetical protein